MRIDRIELIGFKSFSDKTTFHFHPGVTCIVGPNGCGKSNVVDAFRWVLGEQSAKSLRGERMEEVIFNGSVSKKPKGMAEVTLIVTGISGTQKTIQTENEEGLSDIAYVTRRLYRSGESEYILNKNQSRLKDVKDLFLDTGLEVKSYSILEQDRITDILNAKPQDRRFLIEEIAGVMKYNVRKKEALSKLESSRTNLQRINDIIGEVKKQINLLDRLAKKAERYKKLSSEIHTIELKIAKRDYQSLKDSFENILSEYNMLREEDASKRAELARIENQVEVKRLEVFEKEKALEEIKIQFQDIEKDISELEKSVAIAKTERDNYEEYLEKLYQQEEEFNVRESEALIKQEELFKTEADLLSEIEKQKELYQEKADFVKALEEELKDTETEIERKRREIFKVSEELSNLKNDQNKLQSTFDSLKQREAASLKDSEGLKILLTEIGTSLKDLESTLITKNNNLMLLKEQKEIITSILSANRRRIENLKEKLSMLKEELASYTSRIESLREIVFDRSTREVLSQDINFNVLATISDVIEVDDEYEKAIESALSEKVNSFILSSYKEIEAAISALRGKQLGRTAFIPINPVIHGENADVFEGSLGSALNFVKTKEDFSNVVKSLFENFIIVKDLNTALKFISPDNKAFFVTTDGEIVEPTGTVIAGEIKGIFKRKREIRELESAIESNKKTIDRLQSELFSVQQLIERREGELRNIESGIVDVEKEISLLRLKAENYREENERRSRKLAYLTMEIEQLTNEWKSIDKQLTEKNTDIDVAESRKTELEQNSASLQEEIAAKRANLEGHRTEVTDIRLLMTSLSEKIESLNKEKESVSREITETKQKKEFLSEEISSVRSRIIQREKEVKEFEDRIRYLVSRADEFKTEISKRKEVIEIGNQELHTNENTLKTLRNHIDALSNRISELDVSKAEHKLKIETLSENIRQNYGAEIDTLEVEQLTPEDEARLMELKQKVQDLGPVNLGTLEEYEELRERYDFLKNQQEDLNKSIAELEEAITKINATTKRRLTEGFDLLRSKFSEIFLVLFGGGRAELIMTDEDNILETGLDIIAQPPGKKLQNINLLSGGEKTLTVLSLLFASFLIKPTPLCILDEADSALDEANTERFAKMIQELSKGTQFIVITHNRNTMSIADYIYGITMEEAGVSKVISMQLVEA
jgi:chromosome segregation protein